MKEQNRLALEVVLTGAEFSTRGVSNRPADNTRLHYGPTKRMLQSAWSAPSRNGLI